MAVLPTGFGKSMIFTVFALARQELSTTCTRTCIIVISPLKSIIDDQISEMLSPDKNCQLYAREPVSLLYGLTITTFTSVALLSSNSSTFMCEKAISLGVIS